jgi:hypothetical protein
MIPSPDISSNTTTGATVAPVDDQLTRFYREIGISAVAAALNAMVDSMRRADTDDTVQSEHTTKSAA